MNDLHESSVFAKAKTVLKTLCIFLVVCAVTLFSGCDLISSIVGGDDDGGKDAPKKKDVVTVSPTSAQIEVGETIELTATSSEGRAITWISGDEEIAEVDDNGEVTGISEGTATITASDGKQMADCEITVIPAEGSDPGTDPGTDPGSKDPVKVTLKTSKITIAVGDDYNLKATSSDGSVIVWTTSNAEVAKVTSVDDQKGKITAVAVGEAIITATSETAETPATCKVTVEPAPEPVTVTLNTIAKTLTVGDDFDLTATSSDGSAIIWSTNNAAVATVTKVDNTKGKITAVAKGTAVITATSETAETPATCTVTVKPKTSELPDPTDINVPAGYTLVWNDEFNGDSLDMSKWNYQTGIRDNYYGNLGPENWGNDELQYYTNGANTEVSDGTLKIIAKKQAMGDRPYTSARITTRDLYSVTFGYIEARMKTPAIDGMWPAFWMLPNPESHSTTNTEYGGWPANGELDIMEAKGREKNEVDCTLHFGGPDWNIHDMAGAGNVVLSSNTDEWHTYAVQWTSSYIAWIIDGQQVGIVYSNRWWTSAQNAASSAPFDRPYYILLNLAVGGMYDNYTNPPGDFEQATMYVDYVRVFQKL